MALIACHISVLGCQQEAQSEKKGEIIISHYCSQFALLQLLEQLFHSYNLNKSAISESCFWSDALQHSCLVLNNGYECINSNCFLGFN